ncbi:MAG: TolC family protein, partial [Thermodesulfobacteriota bacterium]
MKRKILFFLLSALLFWRPVPCLAEDAPAGPQQLAEVVAEALASNPELRADEARWDTYVQQARQAGSLEDPMIMLRAQNLL